MLLTIAIYIVVMPPLTSLFFWVGLMMNYDHLVALGLTGADYSFSLPHQLGALMASGLISYIVFIVPAGLFGLVHAAVFKLVPTKLKWAGIVVSSVMLMPTLWFIIALILREPALRAPFFANEAVFIFVFFLPFSLSSLICAALVKSKFWKAG